MLKTMCIIVEGKTECNFVSNVLSKHLLPFGFTITPITLPTGKSQSGVAKGGWRRNNGYQEAVKQICNVIKTRRDATLFTTFFDLYGIPSDIPCFSKLTNSNLSPMEKSEIVGNQFKSDIKALFSDDSSFILDAFIPYIQPFEFEAFLFVDVDISAKILTSACDQKQTKLKVDLSQIADQFTTPEHINNSPDKAPSKRLESLVPGFCKNKVGRAGLSWRISEEVGIENIRKVCKHFDRWLLQLELR